MKKPLFRHPVICDKAENSKNVVHSIFTKVQKKKIQKIYKTIENLKFEIVYFS
jgi:hypothetical protein